MRKHEKDFPDAYQDDAAAESATDGSDFMASNTSCNLHNSLSIDNSLAYKVSVPLGCCLLKRKCDQTFKRSLHFFLFQTLSLPALSSQDILSSVCVTGTTNAKLVTSNVVTLPVSAIGMTTAGVEGCFCPFFVSLSCI